ncbi:hypothetical protein BGZ46_007670 [Entomortierella lignicola]|nr:hypothetical protein BGZ46_007670 [Entomortierella lignicola]
MDGEGSTSMLSAKDSANADYQCFRSNGSIVRVKVTHNSALNLKYVFWSDLRICFPGIVRIQRGDVVMTFMRNQAENRFKPFRIEYIPGEILDVIYNSPTLSHHATDTSQPSTNLNVSTSRSSISLDSDQMEKIPQYIASGETKHSSESSLINRTRDELSQMDDSKLASLISLAAKEVLAEKALAAFLTTPHTQEPTLNQSPQQSQQQQRIAESSAVEPTLSSLSSSPSSSSSLEFINDSKYHMTDKYSRGVNSIEENGSTVVVHTTDSNSGKNKDFSTVSLLSEKSAAEPSDATTRTIPNIEIARAQENLNFSADLIDDRISNGQLHSREKPDISIIRSITPPDGTNDEAKAEFERLRRALIFCFNLFCSFLRSTVERQLLQSDKRCQVLVRSLKEVNDRTPQDHALHHQLDLLKRDTVRIRTLFRKMRPEFLQSKADQITGTHFGVFQHLEQKLFIILPESDSPEDGFRLHFLCECCHLTRINHDSNNKGRDNKSTKIAPPHQIHLSKHEGYKLRYTEEFVARYGYHMWILLQLFLNGYKDHGVTIPPLVRGSALFKKIMISINYIESEPDSGDLEGSWDFSRVSEFYVPVSVSKEGSVGSLFRITTKEGFAKWVCFEHYRERFPENDFRILQKTLKTFFYNEALGAVLVSLNSREEASEFYEAIVKATNLQELGIELNWDADEQDIQALQSVLPRTTAVSIKIYVLNEHKTVDKNQTQGSDAHDSDYTLGHNKTNLVMQVIEDRRIQAFHLDFIDHSDHPNFEESLNLTLRNLTSFDNWNPEKTKPALCDMVRTAGPSALTKLSFKTPTLERGFFFINNAIKPDEGLVMVKAMVNSREQVSDRGGNGDTQRSMRIHQWAGNVLRFTNKLEGLWLDVRTPRDTGILQQLIEMNPYLKKLKVTTETNTFYKIYEAVQKAVVVWKHKVPMKLILKGGQDMTLTWSDLVVPPERKQDQIISLEYSAGASNINTVLMFFGYMITHLKCLDFTNLDAKTLEACTRSRGSNIVHLEVNILGLSQKGLEDLAKIVYRSLEPMSQLSSRFSIHLCPMDGIQPDWAKITDFIVMMGPKVEELVIYSSDIDSVTFESFLERLTPKELPLLESLIINGSVGVPTHGPMRETIENSSEGSISTLNGANHGDRSISSQLSKTFLPWLRSFVSELPLQKLGLNGVLLETEEWRSVISKINFSELQILDLKDSMMTMAMLYELPSHFPKYDRFSTTPSPIAACRVDRKPIVWAPFGTISVSMLNALTYIEQYFRDLGISKSDSRTNSVVRGVKASKITTALAISERRRRRTVKLKEWNNGERFGFEIVPRDEQNLPRAQGQQTRKQYAPEKKHTCPVYRIRLPSILDYKLGRYEKAMIQNAIRALLIGCEVD